MGRWVCFDKNYEGTANSLWLSPEESHHLGKVLRARLGDPVKLLNGRGLLADGTVKTMTRDRVELRVEALCHKERARPRVDLALGLVKPKALDTIVRQATEMGVASIQLLECDHAAYSPDFKPQKWERFEALLIEACKQSLHPFLPQLHALQPFESYVSSCALDPCAVKLLASLEPSAKPLRPDSLAKTDRLVCFVGPEGDFSPREYAQLSAIGAMGLSLGSTILRVETAVVAMLGQVELLRQQ